jgi:DNA-binding SARP family transcriptional activator/tetratricopeptide (TPR) repeat protein
VDVCVLGPVELHGSDGPVRLARRQQRLVLGILAVEANRTVSCERLIDLMWGLRAPRNARAAIQTRVSELRSVVGRHAAAGEGIFARGDGYTLTIDVDRVDVHRFQALVAQARQATSDQAVRELLRPALRLWRGPALGGWLPADSHVALCGAVDAVRLVVAEDLFEAELRLGRHQAVADSIFELANGQLQRERLVGLAMTAFHRSARTAEALQLYERCRRWLADELGASPGRGLQDLHLAILRDASDAAGQPFADGGTAPRAESDRPEAFRPVVPQLLPVGIPDFTGRAAEVTHLRAALLQEAGTARLAVVTGAGGVGKTSLSIHVAHQLRERFEHGQLYVDLHGYGGAQTPSAMNVLGRFLRALGVEAALPDTVDERAELYRTLLAERRVLVVLDNARTADQARPLLPGSSSCAVVITSRGRLAAVLGGVDVSLSVLDESQGVRFLSRVVGEQRIGAEPLAAAALARACGGMPLALRISAARLVTKPHWSVGRLAERLADEQRRLDHLAYEDLDVRSTIEVSYRGVDVEARQLLCRLGAVGLAEADVWSSAALLDTSPAQAEEVLEQLVDAQLIDVTGSDVGGYSRYRLHDLVRLFAQERAAADDSAAESDAARRRLLAAWLQLADLAYGNLFGSSASENVRRPAPRHVVDPGLAAVLTAEPLGWFDANRQTILVLVRDAARCGLSTLCWGLACTASSPFEMLRHLEDCREALDVAHRCASAAGDRRGRAATLFRLGTFHGNTGDQERRNDRLQEAVALFAELGDGHDEALATTYLGIGCRAQGRNDLAQRHYGKALALLADGDDYGATATVVRCIAQLNLAVGNSATVDGDLTRALELYRRQKSRRREVQTLFFQGIFRLRQGRENDAERLFVEAWTLARLLGDRSGQLETQRGIALCLARRGATGRAEQALRRLLRQARQPMPTAIEAKIRGDLARLAGGRGDGQ